MATIRYSALVADARGHVGGVTFSNCRSGPVARIRRPPIQRASDRRNKTKAILSQVNYYWRESMTDVLRQAWNARAAETMSTNVLGHKFHASGWSWFLHANLLHSYAGYSLITSPPAQLRIRTPTFTLSVFANTWIRLTDTHGWAPVEEGRVLYQHAHHLPPSINTWAGPWPEVDWPYALVLDAVPKNLYNVTTAGYNTVSFFRFRWIVCDGSTSLPWTVRIYIPTP